MNVKVHMNPVVQANSASILVKCWPDKRYVALIWSMKEGHGFRRK
jgi:hypothetical protein